jgi:molybdopterin-guanine dinucleotide biosynthesis protein A
VPTKHRDVAPLYGAVLAGGLSTRMGEDKGAIAYRRIAHARFLFELLGRHCSAVYLSTRPDQARRPPYVGYPVIVDAVAPQGPVTGLVSVSRAHPQAAWLVTAVDLALLDDATVGFLAGARRADRLATAFLHPDGVVEPLCAIWEPAGLQLLARRLEGGDASPRRCLQAADVELLSCPTPAALRSVDSPLDRTALGEVGRRS